MSARGPFPVRPRRFPVRLTVSRTVAGAFFDSEIMNVSKGGVFLRSDIPLPLGTEVEFEFSLPDSGRILRATGVVVWARRAGTRDKSGLPDHPPGMGVQFKTIDPEDLVFLLEELERIAQNPE